MPIRTNRRRPLVIAVVLLLGFLVAGCGDRPDAQSDDADSFHQALAYSQCMRSSGVPDFPDPKRDGNKVQVDVGKDKDSPAMKTAMEACRDKMPQGDADGPDAGGVDPAKLTDWMKCMRGKLPNFPDAQVSGGTITLDLKGTGIGGDSAEYLSAQRACESTFPGGSLHVVDEG
jgi:hypothetical protein